MTELAGLLTALEDRLRRFGAPVVEALRPGAPADRVRDGLAAEGLAAPGDLVAWWGRHDGVAGPAVLEGPGIVERPAYLATDSAAAAGGAPLYVVDGGAGLPEPSPTPHLGSLEELVSLLVRLFDDGHVRPDPNDPRVPSLRGAPTTEEVCRLTRR